MRGTKSLNFIRDILVVGRISHLLLGRHRNLNVPLSDAYKAIALDPGFKNESGNNQP